MNSKLVTKIENVRLGNHLFNIQAPGDVSLGEIAATLIKSGRIHDKLDKMTGHVFIMQSLTEEHSFELHLIMKGKYKCP